MKIMNANALKLFAYTTSAYALQSVIRDRSLRASRRHPVGDDSTGPAAANDYYLRRRMSGVLDLSRPSNLKKINRYHRVYNGERPSQYGVPGKRERKIIERAERAAKRAEALAAAE